MVKGVSVCVCGGGGGGGGVGRCVTIVTIESIATCWPITGCVVVVFGCCTSVPYLAGLFAYKATKCVGRFFLLGSPSICTA